MSLLHCFVFTETMCSALASSFGMDATYLEQKWSSAFSEEVKVEQDTFEYGCKRCLHEDRFVITKTLLFTLVLHVRQAAGDSIELTCRWCTEKTSITTTHRYEVTVLMRFTDGRQPPATLSGQTGLVSRGVLFPFDCLLSHQCSRQEHSSHGTRCKGRQKTFVSYQTKKNQKMDYMAHVLMIRHIYLTLVYYNWETATVALLFVIQLQYKPIKWFINEQKVYHSKCLMFCAKELQAVHDADTSVAQGLWGLFLEVGITVMSHTSE